MIRCQSKRVATYSDILYEVVFDGLFIFYVNPEHSGGTRSGKPSRMCGLFCNNTSASINKKKRTFR